MEEHIHFSHAVTISALSCQHKPRLLPHPLSHSASLGFFLLVGKELFVWLLFPICNLE